MLSGINATEIVLLFHLLFPWRIFDMTERFCRNRISSRCSFSAQNSLLLLDDFPLISCIHGSLLSFGSMAQIATTLFLAFHIPLTSPIAMMGRVSICCAGIELALSIGLLILAFLALRGWREKLPNWHC